jgi:hypothetical protein
MQPNNNNNIMLTKERSKGTANSVLRTLGGDPTRETPCHSARGPPNHRNRIPTIDRARTVSHCCGAHCWSTCH